MGFEPTDERPADRLTRPVGFGTDQGLALPARAEPACEDLSAPADDADEAPRHSPRPKVLIDHTTSFEAPENARASRLLRARIKVNSTRQGTPRPIGPWSPGAVQKAAERKGIESDEAHAQFPQWPRPVNQTMEYQAFAALSNPTVPVEPAFVQRPRPGLTRITRDPPSRESPRPTTAVPEPLRAAEPVAVPAPLRRHRHVPEKVVAGCLFLAAVGLAWLSFS